MKYYSQHAVSVMSADVYKLGFINTHQLRNGGYKRSPQTATTHTANRWPQANFIYMRERHFWKWFVRNRVKIEKFIDTEDHEDYSIYNRLTAKIKRVNELLIPEVTSDQDKYFLIISCDGISEGIKSVQKLYDSAPQIDNWVFIKFRQPKEKFDLNYKGLEFKYEDIKVWRKFDLEKEKVDIALLIKKYNNEDNRFKALGFLYLDHFIGEYNTMTRVGHIDFLDWNTLEENKHIESINLIDLKREIAEKLY